MKIDIHPKTEEPNLDEIAGFEIAFGDDLYIAKDKNIFIRTPEGEEDIEIGRFIDININPYEIILKYLSNSNVDANRHFLRSVGKKYNLTVKEY